jgi:hypothetical protein
MGPGTATNNVKKCVFFPPSLSHLNHFFLSSLDIHFLFHKKWAMDLAFKATTFQFCFVLELPQQCREIVSKAKRKI